MLGGGPVGVVADLTLSLRFRILDGFEPPRQPPPAALSPSLSKEGSGAIFILGGALRGMRGSPDNRPRRRSRPRRDFPMQELNRLQQTNPPEVPPQGGTTVR